MTVKRRWLVLTSLVAVATTAAALVAASTGGASSGKASGSITVWVDAVRLPVAKLYVKTHPNVKVNVVTYDGDGNGATTMQTKIQLWNRTGKGWPDVVFSEQANDPVWMSQPPFDFALNLKGVFPASLLTGWPAPSLAQCTVNGRLVCLQDNLAQEVLYVNKKLMGQFGYTVPTTWQEWAALGAKVAKEHPGYIIGNMGDSYSHWLYLWPDRCPISQVVAPKTVRINSADVHCTRMATLLDPLIKSGVVPPESIFTPAFAQKYGGDTDKILLMPGPDLVREGHLRRNAEGAGRRDDGRHAAAVEQRGPHDRPGRRRPVDRLEAQQERCGRDRLREVRHDIPGGQVEARTALAGVPVLRPRRHRVAEEPEQGPVLRRSARRGDEGGRSTRLEGVEHGHLSRPARLVDRRRHAARRGQVAQRPAAGARRRSLEQREGGRVQGREQVVT